MISPRPVINLAPSVKARIFNHAHLHDRQFLADIFSDIPTQFAHKLLGEYENRLKLYGRREANLFALSLKELLPELFSNTALPLQATDSDIRNAAEQAAKQAAEYIRKSKTQDAAIAALGRLAKQYEVLLPNKSAEAIIHRMTDRPWWKRTLRSRFQKVEHAAIRAGLVHAKAAPFVSDEAYERAQRQARANARLMESLEAVNEATGEVISMAQIVEQSLANPAHRRSSTMVRIRGTEDWAKCLGYVGYFLTITCPSRMHARLHKSGDANPRYDGTSPKKAQKYLCNLWGDATRKLQRDGLEVFGLRVVEPNHDGTPHWHLLVYVHPDHADAMHATLRNYALMDSPDEAGAQEARFKSVLIDPAKGAAGYVAKYVSKNLDGYAVGQDDETGKAATDTAPRAVVWSRQWNIKQFHFFGLGPITPTRELYRLTALPLSYAEKLGEAFAAVKENDYGAFLKAIAKAGVRLGNHTEERQSSRFPGETTKRVCGVRIEGMEPLTTRTENWVIRSKVKPESERVCLPWTRFNNSAPVDLTEKFEASLKASPVPEVSNSQLPPKAQPIDFRLHGVELERWKKAHAHKWDAKELESFLGAIALDASRGFGMGAKQSPQPRTATN